MYMYECYYSGTVGSTLQCADTIAGLYIIIMVGTEIHNIIIQNTMSARLTGDNGLLLDATHMCSVCSNTI